MELIFPGKVWASAPTQILSSQTVAAGATNTSTVVTGLGNYAKLTYMVDCTNCAAIGDITSFAALVAVSGTATVPLRELRQVDCQLRTGTDWWCGRQYELDGIDQVAFRLVNSSAGSRTINSYYFTEGRPNAPTETVTVKQAGTVTVTVPDTVTVSGTVNVNNYPATQTVAGSVNVGNFPATQTIAGSVSCSSGCGGTNTVTCSNCTMTGTVPVSIDGNNIVKLDTSGNVIRVDPAANQVSLPQDTQDAFSLSWYGAWLIAGLLICLLIAPLFYRAFRMWNS